MHVEFVFVLKLWWFDSLFLVFLPVEISFLIVIFYLYLQKKVQVLLCCVFWPAFGCCTLKADQNQSKTPQNASQMLLNIIMTNNASLHSLLTFSRYIQLLQEVPQWSNMWRELKAPSLIFSVLHLLDHNVIVGPKMPILVCNLKSLALQF